MSNGALVALLNLEDDLKVIAELERGDQILSAAREHRPDVAIIDIDLPGLDGLSAAELLHERLPKCRTLMVDPQLALAELPDLRADRGRPRPSHDCQRRPDTRPTHDCQ